MKISDKTINKFGLTHEARIHLIREKSIAANPEIVEEKLGCRIWQDGKVYVLAIPVEEQGEIEPMGKDSEGEDIWYMPGTRVLGRPIRLADVLLVIGSRGVDAMPDVLVSDTGLIVTHNADRKLNNKGLHWNLRADDLEKQSEETINFLYELLK